VEKKGCGLLIDAWKELPEKLRRRGLTIIGDGPEAQSLRARARAQDNPEIRFCGAQPRHAVVAAMAEHRAFIFPSLRAATGDAEGWVWSRWRHKRSARP